MALKLAPPPHSAPEPANDDFDHEFFRTESLSPIELDAGDDSPGPRSKLRTALHALGAGVASLAVTVLCIYALVPDTDAPATAFAGQDTASATIEAPPPAAAAPLVTHPSPETPAPVVDVPVATPTAQPHARPAAVSVMDTRLRAAHRALARGDTQAAIAHARRVVDQDQERADAWLILGSAYANVPDPLSARLAYRACALHGQGPAKATCAALAR
jgi:hypothetical protein